MKTLNTRWFVILAVALLAITSACSSQASQVGSSRIDTGPAGDGHTINVMTDEFSFTLDTAQAGAGTVTFVVQNHGSMPHDFAIQGNGLDQKTPMIEPGENATLTVALKPGTYTYICTVPMHKQLGMSGTLTVTSS